MRDFTTLFRYDQEQNDQIGTIMDYLNDKRLPGQPLATKTDALKYALGIATIGINAEMNTGKITVVGGNWQMNTREFYDAIPQLYTDDEPDEPEDK